MLPHRTPYVVRAAGWILRTVVVVFLALPVSAQTGIEENELVPWAFLDSEEGISDVEVGGRSIQLVRIPISYRIRSIEENGRGLRFNLPVSLGFHELSADVVTEGQLRENLSTMTVQPGLEWELPVRRGGEVKPYFELGYGSELGGGPSAWIYSVGSRWLQPLPRKGSPLVLGARLEFSGSTGEAAEVLERYWIGELGVERRIQLGFDLRGEPADLGLYTFVHHSFSAIRLEELDGSSTRVSRTALELGFAFGTEPRIEIWGLPLPRIGLGYRFSSNLKSLRINFGFPF